MVSDGSLALWHYNARRRGLQDVYIDWIAQGGFLCQMFSQEQGVPELKGSIAQIVQERCCVFHSEFPNPSFPEGSVHCQEKNQATLCALLLAWFLGR